MGTNVSSQTNDAVTDVVTKAINKVQVDINNKVINTTKSTNNIKIKFVNVNAGDIKIKQINDVTTKALLTADTNVMSAIASNISNDISDKLEASLKQTNEDLNIGQTNVGIISQTSIKNIANNIEQDVRTGVSNLSNVTVDADQSIVIEFSASNIGDVTLDQEAIIKSIAENIASSIIKSTAAATVDNKAATDMKSAVEQKNKGLDIMAWLTTLAIGAVVVGGAIIFIRSGQALKSADSKADKFIDKMAVANAAALAAPTVGGALSTRKKVAIGVIVLLIILILVQYWIHYQFTVLKTNPFTGKMVTDPPITIFRYL